MGITRCTCDYCRSVVKPFMVRENIREKDIKRLNSFLEYANEFYTWNLKNNVRSDFHPFKMISAAHNQYIE